MVEIHRQLTEVYGSGILSVQMVRKWCRELHERRRKLHDESCTCRPKVVMDKSVDTICTLLNKDGHLTLRELKTIMNDNLGHPSSRMLISRIVTNLSTHFSQSGIQKLVSSYDKCLNLFGNYVEK